jgi:hypothetical protein
MRNGYKTLMAIGAFMVVAVPATAQMQMPSQEIGTVDADQNPMGAMAGASQDFFGPLTQSSKQLLGEDSPDMGEMMAMDPPKFGTVDMNSDPGELMGRTNKDFFTMLGEKSSLLFSNKDRLLGMANGGNDSVPMGDSLSDAPTGAMNSSGAQQRNDQNQSDMTAMLPLSSDTDMLAEQNNDMAMPLSTETMDSSSMQQDGDQNQSDMTAMLPMNNTMSMPENTNNSDGMLRLADMMNGNDMQSSDDQNRSDMVAMLPMSGDTDMQGDTNNDNTMPLSTDMFPLSMPAEDDPGMLGLLPVGS